MSIDRREDAGEFYPGGKVISTRPVAAGGDVKHSDFAGLDVKTNTIPDLRETVRELGRRLGATVVTTLAACVAVAATVQTVPVNDLDFDANPSIVTNVVFDAPPDFSTNNTALVKTIQAKAPAPGNYAAVSNAAVHAAATNALQDAAISTLSDTKLDKSGNGFTVSHTENGLRIADNAGVYYIEVAPNRFSTNFPDEQPHYVDWPNSDGTLAQTSDIPDVPAWALAAQKPTYTASEISVDYVWGETVQEFSSNINSFLGTLPSPSDMLIKMYGDNRVATYSGGLYHPVEELYIGDHKAATVADIPDVPAWALEAQKPSYTAAEVGATSPAAVSNIVSTVYVREKLGAWMEYDEATGLYYYCHEEE